MTLTAHEPMRFARLADGPDALPTGTRRAHVNYEGGTSCGTEPTSYERELYRTRTFAHLYDEADVRAATDLRTRMIATLPPTVRDGDCHTCQHAIVTAAHTCPYCGSARIRWVA